MATDLRLAWESWLSVQYRRQGKLGFDFVRGIMRYMKVALLCSLLAGVLTLT